MLHPSVIERFIIVRTAQMSPAMRRTLRSNLRALARDAMANRPRLRFPSREAAKAPYFLAEIGAYLALADAQPTLARRRRLSGLIAWGPGRG